MNEGEYEYRRIVRSMEMAAALGIPVIVIHSAMTADNLIMLDFNERYYSSLLPYAERFGIKIADSNIRTDKGILYLPLYAPSFFKDEEPKEIPPLDIDSINSLEF